MIAELEPDQDPAAACLRGLLQNIETLQGMRDRLFQQNMASGLGGGNCHIEVHGSRVGDDHGIRMMVCERFLQIRFDGVSCQFVLRQGRLARAKQHDVLFPQGNEIAEMSSSYGTETGDENFHVYLRSSTAGGDQTLYVVTDLQGLQLLAGLL